MPANAVFGLQCPLTIAPEPLPLYKFISRLPFPVLYGIARVTRVLLYRVARYRRKVVAKNLLHAFPEKSASERLQIEHDFYDFMADNAFEVIKSITINPQEIKDRVVFENPEVITQYTDKGESVFLLALHQASWEWTIHALQQLLPCPMSLIYKPLHDESMDTLMLEARERTGGVGIPFKDVMRTVLRGRKDFRAIAMIADQAPISREKRYWKMFMNRPAPFYFGPQVIARATQYPAIFVHVRLVRRGHYSIRLEQLGTPPYAKDSNALLDRYIEVMEEAIRDQPHTFLWSNKKWRSPKPHEMELLPPECRPD